MSAQTLLATPDPRPRPPVRHPAPGDLYTNHGGELLLVLAVPTDGSPVRAETMHGGLPRRVPAWVFAGYQLQAKCPPHLGFRPARVAKP